MLDIQETQRAYYWSACIPAIFRKHGLIDVQQGDEQAPDNEPLQVVTRHAELSQGDSRRACVIEGPINESTAAMLQLDAEHLEAQQVELLDEAGAVIGALAYPRFTVREIPTERGRQSEPYPFVSDDANWNSRTIRISALKPSGRWRPIAFARTDNDAAPFAAAVSDGDRTVFSIPIFDLLAASHAFAPLPVGYYAHTARGNSFEVEQWLIERVVEPATRSALGRVRVGQWPSSFEAALTVRHDYDRPVPPGELAELLALYDRLGVRSSWGFLVDKLDPVLARELVKRGHEVLLHTQTSDSAGFRRELERFGSETGLTPSGYTSHGGLGAGGFLGQAQHLWAVENGLRYGELLGRPNRLPHPAFVARPGRIPTITPLILPACHQSLDAGTAPDAHHLSRLEQVIPDLLGRGFHVVLMNHPDVHLAELRKLLTELNLRCVWCATLDEVARWSSCTKFQSCVDATASNRLIRFGAPLPADTVVDVIAPGKGETRVQAKANQSEVLLDAPSR